MTFVFFFQFVFVYEPDNYSNADCDAFAKDRETKLFGQWIISTRQTIISSRNKKQHREDGSKSVVFAA